MDRGVWILGCYRSDFAHNMSKEGLDFARLTFGTLNFGGSTTTTVSFVVRAVGG
jgi:hypothetical protein